MEQDSMLGGGGGLLGKFLSMDRKKKEIQAFIVGELDSLAVSEATPDRLALT